MLTEKELQMRGRHLRKISNGTIWPWTEHLSKKSGFELVEEYKGPTKFEDMPILKEEKEQEIPDEVTLQSEEIDEVVDEKPTASIRVSDGLDTTVNLGSGRKVK
jgi:hypothetical protein